MMEPTNNNSSGLVGEPPSYNLACHIPPEVNKNGLPRENFVNTTDSAGSGQASPSSYPSPTPPPPAAFLSPEPALHLQESVLTKPESVISGKRQDAIIKADNLREHSQPGTPQCRWSFSSDQPINFNSDDESFPPPPPEFMSEDAFPKIQFSYSTDSDNNQKKEEIRKNRRPLKNKHRRVESLSPVPASQESYKSTSPEGASSAQSNDSASTNLASGSDIHLRPPSDRPGKTTDKGQLKRMKPYASPMLPKDIKFKSLEVSSYDDDSVPGSEHDMETDHDDVHTPLLQDGAGSPAKISNLSTLSGGTRNSYPGMATEDRMRNYTLGTDVRLPLLKISSDPRESRKSRDRLNKQDSKSDTRSSNELYDVRLDRDGSYPAEAEITVSNDDLSVSNPDIPNAVHTGNAIGYADSCDSDSRRVGLANNKRNTPGNSTWRPGETEDPDAVDTMPKERKKSRLKKPFRSRSYPICIAVSFTTMLCINPPIGVVAVFLSYLSWKAYDKGDKTAGYCLARLSLYVSIAGIVTTMTLVITILYQTTIGF
ncbi:uncharacterized protein LOC135499677 [Lineus longissimus]|uniref:uncharacterized protein LOC135499677 n=1 Tax=Lineus longissimus TaxID=88925 RepID=UPI00315DF6CD